MFSLGYTEDDVTHLDFTSFTKKFKEIQYLPNHTQKSSYDLYEKTRIQIIEQFLEEKTKADNDPNYTPPKTGGLNKDKVRVKIKANTSETQ